MATSAQINSIQQLYIAYFNRPADAAGLDFWANSLTSGSTLASISATFAATPEYKATFAGMSNDQIVNTIYLNLFNRTPDGAGLKYWSDLLTNHTLSVNDIVNDVAASAQQDPAKGPDTISIQSKVSAAVAFTNFLHSDVAARVAYSSGSVNAVGANYLHGVTDAASLAAASAGLPTTTDAALLGGSAPGVSTVLTAGVDTLVGTAGNDTFTAGLAVNPATGLASIATLTAFDSIDGGAGTDTLNVYYTGAVAAVAAATVKNVEVVNIHGDNAFTGDITAWTGVQTVNLTAAAFAQAITTSAATVNVTGGTTVGVTDSSSAGVTTAVSVSGNSGVATITGNAIATVSLANTAAAANITNATGDAAGSLTLNVSKVTGGAVITDTAGEYSTITVNATGKSSVVVDDAALTTVTLGGSAALTFGTNSAVLKTATITGAGGVTTDLSAIGTLKSVDASASTGTNSVTLATTSTYVGGAGNDTVTLAATPVKAIDGGAGANTLNFNGIVDLSTLTKASLLNATNFQTLELTGVVGTAATPAHNTLDVSGLSATFTGVTVNTAGDLGNLIFNNVATGFNFTELNSQAFNSTIALKTDGSADVLNLTVGGATSAALDESTGGGIVATGFETINVAAHADTSAAAVTHLVVLTDITATTLNVTGEAGVDFTGSSLTHVATVAAGTSTGNITIDLSGGLTTGVSVTTGSGNDTITTAGAAGKVDTINTGTGNDVVLVGAGNNSITFGGGDKATGVTLHAGNGNNIVTINGGGSSTIVVGTGNNNISGSTGADSITVGHGANVITLNGGADTVAFTAAATSSAVFTTIKDIVVGDTLDFSGINNITNATGKLGAAISSGVNDYQTFLNQAVHSGVAGTVSWFSFGGDTYVVEEVGVTGSFVAGTDQVVKLTGTHDLSTATVTHGAGALIIA